LHCISIFFFRSCDDKFVFFLCCTVYWKYKNCHFFNLCTFVRLMQVFVCWLLFQIHLFAENVVLWITVHCYTQKLNYW
jgi:hypothetical protein